MSLSPVYFVFINQRGNNHESVSVRRSANTKTVIREGKLSCITIFSTHFALNRLVIEFIFVGRHQLKGNMMVFFFGGYNVTQI